MADRVLPRFDFEAAMLPYVGQGIGQGRWSIYHPAYGLCLASLE